MKYEILKGKNILITGITGFVGQHLGKKLQELGAHVYGITRNLSDKSHIKGDIVDYGFLEDVIKNKKIDICFHLAGEALVETGQENPYRTFHTNLLGTLNVLELGRKYNLEKIIVASTSHVYGDNKVPYFEKYPPRPSRPYETSKTVTDLIAQSYADTFSLPVLIPRFVNIYGPGDTNFTRLIPKTIQTILSDSSPTMWGGDTIRQYLYIDDAIQAYLDLATADISFIGKNRIFNFGSPDKISVKSLIELIIKFSDKNVAIEIIKDGREAEIRSQYLSWHKARKLLHWYPKTTLEKGLQKTIAWYKEK